MESLPDELKWKIFSYLRHPTAECILSFDSGLFKEFPKCQQIQFHLIVVFWAIDVKNKLKKNHYSYSRHRIADIFEEEETTGDFPKYIAEYISDEWIDYYDELWLKRMKRRETIFIPRYYSIE